LFAASTTPVANVIHAQDAARKYYISTAFTFLSLRQIQMRA